MNKHAYLIIANRNFNQLCTLLALLDDYRNDIYLLIDAKSTGYSFDKFKNLLKYSNLFRVTPIKIYWGDYSQIQAELNLLKSSASKHYSFYHLLSGLDLPLHNQNYIHSFFSKYQGKQFLTFTDREIFLKNHIKNRVKYFHYLSKISEKAFKYKYWIKLIHLYSNIELSLQKLINVNRWGKNSQELMYGSNWFSIDDDFAHYIIEHEKWIKKFFSFSVCGDELFVHTLAVNSRFDEQIYNKTGVKDKPSDRQGNMRFINWWDGGPYTWKVKDFNALINIRNKGYLYSRKFDEQIDSKIIEMVADIVRKE